MFHKLMKKHYFIHLLLLTIVVGCGDEVIDCNENPPLINSTSDYQEFVDLHAELDLEYPGNEVFLFEFKAPEIKGQIFQQIVYPKEIGVEREPNPFVFRPISSFGIYLYEYEVSDTDNLIIRIDYLSRQDFDFSSYAWGLGSAFTISPTGFADVDADLYESYEMRNDSFPDAYGSLFDAKGLEVFHVCAWGIPAPTALDWEMPLFDEIIDQAIAAF